MAGRASTRLRYLYLAAALALAAAYAFAFGLSVRPPVLLAVVISAIALTVVAHRQGRIDRFTTVAFIGGFVLFEIGDLTAYEMYRRHVSPGGFPSLQDVFYFAGYPFFIAAFTRQYPRDRRSASAAVLFSVTLAAAVGFVIWAAAFSRASRSLHPTLVAATYPVLDLVLVFGVTQALAAGRLDRRASIPWLGGTIAFFVADLGYAFVGLNGSYRGSFQLPSLYVIAYACLAAGTLAAAPVRPTTIIRLSRPRVALMFLAALAVPVALIAAAANHADVYASAIWTAAIVVLVFAQFAALLEERGAAEGRLQTRERELQTLVDNAPALLWTTDGQLRPLSVQGAALKALDWGSDPLAHLTECVSHGSPNFGDAHRRALEGTPVDLEESIGARVFRCHIESTMNGRGEVVGTIGVGLDVTDRALLEEQLLQAQKMEAVGQLAGTIAHDFNNLLTGMSGYAELALAKLGDHSASSDIAEIVRASERGASLTSRLAIFSRKRVAEPRVVDANGVVSGLEAFLTRVIGEGTTVRYSLDRQPAPVRIDPRELEQAILNLAINGRDAMNGAGELSISTRRAGSDFILEVTDIGVGMDESTRERIFDAFFTTKEPGKGTGLGLASVQAIVSGAHGRVDVASEPGVGTTFTVSLPIDQSAGDLAAAADGGAAAVVGGKESILLLDDNEQVRQVTATMLERLGYHVVAVGTAREALRVAALEPLGLLVTDVVLPDGDGRGVAAEIVDLRPGLAVLFISGFTPEDGGTGRVPSLTSRHAFLPKPYSLRELAAATRDLLD